MVVPPLQHPVAHWTQAEPGMEHQTSPLLLLVVASLLLGVAVEAQNRQGLTRVGKTIIIPLPKDAAGTDVYPDCQKGKVKAKIHDKFLQEYFNPRFAYQRLLTVLQEKTKEELCNSRIKTDLISR